MSEVKIIREQRPLSVHESSVKRYHVALDISCYQDDGDFLRRAEAEQIFGLLVNGVNPGKKHTFKMLLPNGRAVQFAVEGTEVLYRPEEGESAAWVTRRVESEEEAKPAPAEAQEPACKESREEEKLKALVSCLDDMKRAANRALQSLFEVQARIANEGCAAAIKEGRKETKSEEETMSTIEHMGSIGCELAQGVDAATAVYNLIDVCLHHAGKKGGNR